MTTLNGLHPTTEVYQTVRKIHLLSAGLHRKRINLMEVCGTHTMSVYRHGIKNLLPSKINLLAGPGCPVCVTPTNIVDVSLQLSKNPNVILASFGDMMKVPGKMSSLARAKADGADIRVVYSPLDALHLAKNNPSKEVIFIAVGFETTAPTVAVTVQQADKDNIPNFTIICAHKTMPQAMLELVKSGELDIAGFLCPGHVSTITGAKLFDFLTRDYHIPCVVSGFEPLDILNSIEMLVRQLNSGISEVQIQYVRCITWEGNLKAQSIINLIFEPADSEWRGIGCIPGSGLRLRQRYQKFDALLKFNLQLPDSTHHPACICGEILRGISLPGDCKLFHKSCTPENPMGPCMVSNEGTCAAYYKYVKVGQYE